MVQLDLLPVSKFPKPFDYFGHAPVGSLLQVRPANRQNAIIGLRCNFGSGSSAKIPGVLELQGEKAGILLTSNEMDGEGAVDISKLVSICVLRPAVRPLGGELDFGDVCIDRNTGAAFVWARLLAEHAWVCIKQAKKMKRGDVFERLDRDACLYLGPVCLELTAKLTQQNLA